MFSVVAIGVFTPGASAHHRANVAAVSFAGRSFGVRSVSLDTVANPV